MKANKKLVQNHLMKDTGKIVLLKDLHNIAASLKQPQGNNSLTNLITLMKKSPGITKSFSYYSAIYVLQFAGALVDVLADADKNLKAIFFQTPAMQDNFRRYPEFVMIDATYKLNDLRMPLFILLIVDGNGLSEIVALCITADESKDTITEMLRSFKTHNKDHSKVACVMADKDLVERAVISSELANAHLLICLFHTMRSFKREITCEKLGITSAERTLALEIIQKLAYSQSEDVYSKHYKELQNTNLHSVISYFNENWHGIRDQWVEGLKNNHFNMLNRTNNRLECINQKIKSVVSKNSDLNTFWVDLMHCLNTLNVERDQKAVNVQLKTPIRVGVTDSDVDRYAEFLTPFAFSHVIKQYELRKNVATFDSGGGVIEACKNTCQCSFFTVMKLPCRHILALRTRLQMPLCDKNICHVRWTKSFYLSGHRISIDHPDNNDSVYVRTSKKKSSVITSSQQKYREAFSMGQKIASCISELGMREYTSVINELESMLGILQQGKLFSVVRMDNGTSIESLILT